MDRRSGWVRASLFSLLSLLALILPGCAGSGSSRGAPGTDSAAPPIPPGDGPVQAPLPGPVLEGSGGVNAPEHRDKPYVVLISFDGFRWDYQDRYPTPGMDRLAARGIRADGLIPVFPTKTFPNHYSVATGMYPGAHGLVANSFLDPGTGLSYAIGDRDAVENGFFYGGEPIWVTAEQQGMVSAAFFFVGTEAPVRGVYATHWNRFDGSVPPEARVDQVLEWLAEPVETRPHMITLYFEHVDGAGHRFGPESGPVAEAVALVDGMLDRLLDGIDALPHGDQVHVLLVSDHGMGAVDPSQVLYVDEVVSLDGFRRVGGGELMLLYRESASPERVVALRDSINAAWDGGRAYLPEEAPREYHVEGNPRFGDLILVADFPGAVSTSSWRGRTPNPGSHGWPPDTPEMKGIFLAGGGNLPAGLRIGDVRAVDVYPLMTRLLGLQPGPAVQGEGAVWDSLLLAQPAGSPTFR